MDGKVRFRTSNRTRNNGQMKFLMSWGQSWHSVCSYRFSPLDQYRYRSGSVLDRTKVLTSVRSFKAVRTDVIGTEQQSEPTDVESVFLHVRTEPIGKIVAFPEPNRYYVI